MQTSDLVKGSKTVFVSERGFGRIEFPCEIIDIFYRGSIIKYKVPINIELMEEKAKEDRE